MHIVAIIQARMGSTRLPEKMMMDIAGRPPIQHVVERVRLAKRIDDIVLATTEKQEDDILARFARTCGVEAYRGSENDVLDRYYCAAREAHADAVVRITGDCPLIDPAVIDDVVGAYASSSVAYASNIHPPTFPDGLDVEVFSFSALEKAWKEATLSSEREHVTPYIWKHPEIFSNTNIVHTPDLSAHRWTLDTMNDLFLIRRIAEALAKKGNPTDMQSVLRILDLHSDWLSINGSIERNEGYKKSLAQD